MDAAPPIGRDRVFGYAMILGGFGAPLFLFLAGVQLVLSAESKFRKTGDFAGSWWAVQKRGWQIFGLAFLFRLQSYILSGGYSALSLLKVDILNVMGPAIAFAALAGRMAPEQTRARGVLFAAAAVAIPCCTPIVRVTPLLDWLPDPVEWYFRPIARPHQLHAVSRGRVSCLPGPRWVRSSMACGPPERARRLQLTLAVAGGLLMWHGATRRRFCRPFYAPVGVLDDVRLRSSFSASGSSSLLLPLALSVGARSWSP